jgi:hypothetical protein
MLVNCDLEGCTRRRLSPPDACVSRRPIILSFALRKQRTPKLLADRLRVEAIVFRMPGCSKPAPSIPSPLGTCQRFIRKESWVSCTTCFPQLSPGRYIKARILPPLPEGLCSSYSICRLFSVRNWARRSCLSLFFNLSGFPLLLHQSSNFGRCQLINPLFSLYQM